MNMGRQWVRGSLILNGSTISFHLCDWEPVGIVLIHSNLGNDSENARAQYLRCASSGPGQTGSRQLGGHEAIQRALKQ